MQAKQFKFVSGQYSAEEANDLLNHMLKNEMNIQKLKNYMSLVRTEKPCTQSTSNLEGLRNVSTDIEVLINEAKKENRKIVIESTVSISCLS